MLERYTWVLENLWDFFSGLWLKIFTMSSIPVMIFSLLTVLLMIAFLYFIIKSKRPRVRRILGYCATTSFIFCIFSLGIANKGMPVDTLQKSVQLIPTGDYVIGGMANIDLGGVNMVVVPIDDYKQQEADTTGNDAWRTARFIHLDPAQLHKLNPRAGQEITIAMVKDSYRVFERLEPLPGDRDSEKAEQNQGNKVYGMK